MYQLNQTDMDIYFDGKRLFFGPDVAHTGFGSRYVGDLTGVFRDADNVETSELCYDFYRGIGRFDDIDIFARHGLRYDITVIMQGTVNGEFKKTSGHYHGLVPRQSTTYPEVYEVICGTAMYVLQKPKATVTEDTCEAEAVEFLFVEVRAGESVVIPGGYGHCSINMGGEPLVFSNIAAIDCPLFYAPVKNMHGMAYYLLDGSDSVVKNPRYTSQPAPRRVRAVENPELGIVFGESVYREFIHNPGTFQYLTDPKGYELTDLIG